MKYLTLAVTLSTSLAIASASDMTVSTWDAGCNHTMTTNHFVLEAGETTNPIYLDFKSCPQSAVGSLLYFGYNSSFKNRSPQLSAKDKIEFNLYCNDLNGTTVVEDSSISGSGLTELFYPIDGCYLTATNTQNKKSIRLRLRSQLIEN